MTQNGLLFQNPYNFRLKAQETTMSLRISEIWTRVRAEVSKVLALQARRPEFDPPRTHIKKAGQSVLHF